MQRWHFILLAIGRRAAGLGEDVSPQDRHVPFVLAGLAYPATILNSDSAKVVSRTVRGASMSRPIALHLQVGSTGTDAATGIGQPRHFTVTCLTHCLTH